MRSQRRDYAFSLVELTLAIGIVGFALLAILGLIPIGQQAARDAVDDTKASLIEQDVFNRVRAAINSTSAFNSPGNIFPNPPVAPNFYYTKDGVFFSDQSGLAAATSKAVQNGWPVPVYGVTVVIGNGFAQALPNISNSTLKPVTASLGYPIDSNGHVIGPVVGGVQPNAARKTFTFYLRRL